MKSCRQYDYQKPVCIFAADMEKDSVKKLIYNIFRKYVEWAVRTSYSRITVKGKENIPDAGTVSVIFALNHCNTMMDSLVLLQSRKEPTSFVARADVFNNPLAALILKGVNILPIYRSRDGEHSHEKNVPVFNAVVDILNNGMAFSIHPEGTHRARRSLLPMKKGIFRIAFQARRSNPDRPVVIVPAALDYDDFFNNMRPVTLSYGRPIPINGDEDMDVMSGILYDRMSELFTFFPDDERLQEAEAAFDASRKPHYIFLHHILAAALLPVFVLTGCLCSPMIIAAAIIKSKIKDKAWLNTVRFSCKLALTPFTVLTVAIVGAANLYWPFVIMLAVLTALSHPVFYLILVFYKRLYLPDFRRTS